MCRRRPRRRCQICRLGWCREAAPEDETRMRRRRRRRAWTARRCGCSSASSATRRSSSRRRSAATRMRTARTAYSTTPTCVNRTATAPCTGRRRPQGQGSRANLPPHGPCPIPSPRTAVAWRRRRQRPPMPAGSRGGPASLLASRSTCCSRTRPPLAVTAWWAGQGCPWPAAPARSWTWSCASSYCWPLDHTHLAKVSSSSSYRWKHSCRRN